MPLHFDLFTLLPDVCAAYTRESILKRAQEAGLVTIQIHNIRDYAEGKHLTTDDLPYGGGGGMVMKPEPVFAAVEGVLGQGPGAAPQVEPPAQTEAVSPTANARPAVPIILLTPQGRVFSQTVAQELAQHQRIVLICGRYEGFDERIREHLVTDEISIGDYVLTGGELAALVVVDAVTRLLPGVLGDPTGALDDSHASGLLEYPHYTRPPDFRGWQVPEILLSGHHARIEQWRRQEALRRTYLRRPDMLAAATLSEEDRQFIAELAKASTSSVSGEAGRRDQRPKPPVQDGVQDGAENNAQADTTGCPSE
jgi:tRNA (guanine37-N1)-methyltransferase